MFVKLHFHFVWYLKYTVATDNPRRKATWISDMQKRGLGALLCEFHVNYHVEPKGSREVCYVLSICDNNKNEIIEVSHSSTLLVFTWGIKIWVDYL